ncbi:MAG: class I SAM-dependent methyltransferase [Myxococcota bacterium]|jgi:23S rRNA G2069 N7-methylase RlmK/C1962 C5-methylase RlmI|nr:class I SAM-dependent methyltransferase [Myxococcota bacterium]
MSIEHADSLEESLHNRLERNLRRLAPWANREGITCYRVYDKDIPEIPLSIDWYEGRLHVSCWDSAHRPVSELQLEKWIEAAARALGVKRQDAYAKHRSRQRDGEQYQRLSGRAAELTVSEAGLRFVVNLSDFVDTGLFLDARRLRAMVREESAGKRVLNLFCYTGAFTVHAAKGGAVATTSVDLSNTYLDWARRNLAANDLLRPQHQLVRDDALKFLANHAPPASGYDLAVVDPPTMSRSKKMSAKFDVQRDHVALLRQSLRLLRSGGRLYFCTNFQGFRPALEELEGASFEEITSATLPFDYRNKRIHRSFRIDKTG